MVGGGPAESRPLSLTVVDLVAADVLDTELAALVWLLLEGDTPVVVCGEAPRERRREVLGALLAVGTDADVPDHAPEPTNGPWDARLSARLLALKPGDRFAAVVDAPSLLDLLAFVTSPLGGLTEDEARAMGLVIVVGADGRLDAAHLLRPVERDGQGHLQRRPPAVLASRNPSTSAMESFAWGIEPELADRLDRSQSDLVGRLRFRRRLIDELVASGERDADVIRANVRAHLAGEPPRDPAPNRPPAASPEPGPPHVH